MKYKKNIAKISSSEHWYYFLKQLCVTHVSFFPGIKLEKSIFQSLIETTASLKSSCIFVISNRLSWLSLSLELFLMPPVIWNDNERLLHAAAVSSKGGLENDLSIAT